MPFDSDYKFMATFHEMTGDDGRPVVRCYVKGAPDVLIARGHDVSGTPTATLVPITDENRHLALEANDRIAKAGERVMVVAQRDFDPATLRRRRRPASTLVHDLTLLAMVGIVDPPRPEAKAAIAECHDAGHPGPDDHRRPRRPPRPRSPASWASRAGRSPAPSSPR